VQRTCEINYRIKLLQMVNLYVFVKRKNFKIAVKKLNQQNWLIIKSIIRKLKNPFEKILLQMQMCIFILIH